MSRLRPLLLTLAVASTATLADAPPPKAATCQACHGAQGVSIAPDIPNLAGQKAAYLVRQLEAFQAGTRKNDLMAAMAAQLTPQDMQTLAAYWSSLPAAPLAAASAPVSPHAASVSAMTLPQGFPQGFTEYQRDAADDGATVALRYANAVALRAARAGQLLPDGSVLITATHAVAKDAQGQPLKEADGRPKAGALQGYAGMESRAGWGDAIPPMLRNGHWNYGLWSPTGQSRLGGLQPRCLACHQPKAADSYVFTLAGLKKATVR